MYDLPPSLHPSLPPSFARTHCLSDPVDPTTYHISSTTPPRGIINIIINNINNNQYHSDVTNTPSHPYDPSPDSRIDHTNRNHHRMDLSSLSLSSIAIAPPPSQLYTLHCTTTLCMSHTNSSFPNRRLPCSGSKSSSSSSSTSKQRCLVCLSYCTAQLHVLQSSIRLVCLHLPIHHLISSFQLQDLLFYFYNNASPPPPLVPQLHHQLPHEHVLYMKETHIYIWMVIQQTVSTPHYYCCCIPTSTNYSSVSSPPFLS